MNLQHFIDKWYLAQNKDCCAGCDWWRFHNAIVGDCIKSSPVSGAERIGMLKIHRCSLLVEAGHVMTPRNHVCGEFIDTYNWPIKET